MNELIPAVQRYMQNLKEKAEKPEELKVIKEEAVHEPKRHQSAAVSKRHKLRLLRNDQSYSNLKENQGEVEESNKETLNDRNAS